MEKILQKDLNSVIEKTLSENKIKIFDENSSKQLLLQELSIYYRELEFQNDELRNIQFNLEKTRDELAELIENAPVGYVIYDDSFKIETTNKYFEKLTGLSKEELKGRQIRDFISYNSQDAYYFHIEKLKRNNFNDPVEIKLTSIASAELDVKIESYRHAKDEKLLFLTAFTDITLLKKIQTELSVSHNDLNNIVSNSPIHIWKFDGKSFIFANAVMLDFFGLNKSKNIDFALWKYSVHPDDTEDFNEVWNRSVFDKVEFDFEVRLKSKYNSYRSFWSHVVPVFDSNEEFVYFQGYNVDITDKLSSEKALLESEEKYRLIAENTSDAILLLDEKHYIQYASPVFLVHNNLQLPSSNSAALSYFHSIHPSDRDTIQLIIKQAIESHKEDVTYTYKVFGDNAAYLWKEDHVKFKYDSENNHKQTLIVSRDITERKRNESKIAEYQKDLKSYAGHLHAIREEERTNLAREIHDDMGQILVALKIEVGILKNELSKYPEFAQMQKSIDAFAKISTMVDNTIKTSRRIITGLRPDIIEILGFVDTVKAYINEFGERNKILATFSSNSGKTNLKSEVELSLFRILQEALTNVSRHSMADKVSVKLEVNEQKVMLIIKDNGIGFDVSENKKQESYGMIGMKERVFLLDGQLSINSSQGKGTEIIIEIPAKI